MGLAPVRANATRKKLELKVAELEEKRANLAAKVEESCSKYPLDIDAVVDAMDEVALVERKVSQCQQLIEDLFPEKG